MGQRPSVNHSSKLASVEWQCVLQHLDAVSILRAARCCRSIHAAAREPFAWRYAALPFAMRSAPKPAAVAAVVSPLPSVRALIPLSVTWTIEGVLRYSEFALQLDWLNSVQLRRLVIDPISELRVDQWTAMLSQPGMQSLTHFEARGLSAEHDPITTLKLIHEHMPRLESLSLFLDVPPDAGADEQWAQLVRLQGLRTLSLEFSGLTVDNWVAVLEQPQPSAPKGANRRQQAAALGSLPFAHLSQLSGLTSLRLAARGLRFDFLRLLAPVGLPLLRTLILDGATIEVAALPLAEQVFRLLPSLRHLRLDRPLNADNMLRAITGSSATSLSSLVTLTVRPHSDGFFAQSDRHYTPSADALASVLRHLPSLIVELVIDVPPRLLSMTVVQNLIASRRKEWTVSQSLQSLRGRILIL